MARALNEFLAAATADTIRCTNQFEVEAISGYSDIDAVLKDITLFGQTFTVPKRTIEYAEVSYKGYAVGNLVPTKMDMTKEISMDVLDDVNGTNRRVFLAWMNKVMNFAISEGSVFEGDRGVNEFSTIRLRLFDKDNTTVIQTYKFYNTVVKEVGETSLTYDGGDVSKFTVNFGCTYWEIEEAKKGSFLDLR
jgi:hypothetical protein